MAHGANHMAGMKPAVKGIALHQAVRHSQRDFSQTSILGILV
jgi:hypothetical protein